MRGGGSCFLRFYRNCDWFMCEVGVKAIGIQVGPVWPTNGAELGIHARLGEKCGIYQWCKNPFEPDELFHIDDTFNTVLEC